MPNIKSAKKRVRADLRKTLRNKINKSKLRTSMKKALIENSSKEDILSAISALDRAVSKGLIHKNNAARHKSSLAKKLNVA